VPSISVPARASRGQNVRVQGSNFDESVKFMLTTVDDQGTESGWYVDPSGALTTLSTNSNRPAPGGSFDVGIRVPPRGNSATIRAYQNGVIVATAAVSLATTGLPHRVPVRLPDST
jgi:hypothetical protein